MQDPQPSAEASAPASLRLCPHRSTTAVSSSPGTAPSWRTARYGRCAGMSSMTAPVFSEDPTNSTEQRGPRYKWTPTTRL